MVTPDGNKIRKTFTFGISLFRTAFDCRNLSRDSQRNADSSRFNINIFGTKCDYKRELTGTTTLLVHEGHINELCTIKERRNNHQNIRVRIRVRNCFILGH